MRILILSQYFWPENFIINDVAWNLASQGHEVVVATAKPNYPSGKISAGYTSAGVDRETFKDCVEVVRIPLRPRGNADIISLSLNYLSFVVNGVFYFPFLLRKRRFDAILVFCVSPITAAIPAVVLKWCKGAHLALWIQDLWPESVKSSGLVRSRFVLGFLGLLVRAIYVAADTLLVQSEAFAARVARYANANKIVYLPNLAPDQPGEASRTLPSDLSETLENHFCVVFAGNLGKAQGLEAVIEAAGRLRDRPDIRLVLVGDGSEAKWLRETVAKEGLNNIVLPGWLEPGLMPKLFAHADTLLISLKSDPALDATVPSKVQAYMKAGRPLVGAVNGECARVIAQSGAGLVVPAGDGAAMAEAIVTLCEMPSASRERFGVAAHAFFETNYSESDVVGNFLQLLQTRIKGAS